MDHLLLNPMYLERTQIDDMLTEADQLPLVFVIAPMGYGKTTAVHHFLEHQAGTKLWLPFGQNEVDEFWIWTRLCRKLEALGFSQVSFFTENGLPQNQYEIDTFISTIEDSFPEPFYLILDDCHEFESPSLVRLLESIACQRIKNLHIFLLSRTYLSLPYEELLAKRIGSVIGQSAFALTRQEITDFFALNGILLPLQDQQQIYEYTEGWMSAVYLILTDYTHTGRFRNLGGINTLIHSFIYQYIPNNVKYILMQLSILDTFTMDQSIYITQSEECPVLLSQLEKSISFFRYDSSSDCYIIHGVLRSILLAELDKSSMDKSLLYHRAGEWFEENGLYIYAILNYQKAGDTSAVFAVLEQYGCGMLYNFAPNVLKHFFLKVGTEEALLHPAAYLPYIFLVTLNEEFIRGRALFEEAREYYSTHTCPTMPANEIMGNLYIIRWLLEFNDLEQMTYYASQAYELLGPNHNSLSPVNFILTYGAPENLLLYHREPGNLKRIVELEKQYTSYYMKLINGKDCDWQQLYEAEYLFTTGQIPQAEALVEIACEKARLHKQPCIIISAYFLHLRCQIYFGNKQQFEALIQELKEIIYAESSSTIRMDYEISVGYLYGCLGQLDNIEPWIIDLNLDNCNRIIRSVRSSCISHGLTLIHKKEWVRLENLADEMSIPYSSSYHIITQIYTQLFYAISAFHLYGMQKGQEHLEKSLNMAKPDGIKMPFVEFMPNIAPMLEKLIPDYTFVAEICTLGKKEQKGIDALNTKMPTVQQPHLTQRELELMKLVSQGFKNTEISHNLNVALVTVEKKLTSIYRKLNVSNRAAALRILYEAHILK